MSADSRQCTALFLSAFLAHAPGYAEMFLRLYPERPDLAQLYLAAVDAMREWHEGQRELEVDENGQLYLGVKVA